MLGHEEKDGSLEMPQKGRYREAETIYKQLLSTDKSVQSADFANLGAIMSAQVDTEKP